MITHASTLRELSTANLGTLRYHEAGEGPVLLMLHGSGPGVTGWRNFGDNLETFARHFRCLVLEFPGFGVSDATEEHPMAVAGASVTALLDGLGITEPVSIIGNSMGGIVGTQYAINNPERVTKLVTIGGMGVPLFSIQPSEGIELLMQFTEEPTRERLIAWLNSMVYDRSMITEELIEERWQLATEPVTLDFARRMYSRQAMAAAAQAAATTTPYWAKLNQITAEVLITWGREDRVSPLDLSLLPMKMIPRAELHVLPRCGHWAMIEAKEAWESAVLAFLTR